MKNIIVISGSPRKNGDTAKLTRLVEERMKSYGEVAFETIFLKEQNIEYCRGCLRCMKMGEEACPIKDDVIPLRDRLLAADGVIFVTPVYVHTVTALMKNFLDRFAFFMHRPAFHNRPAMIITSTELSGMAETIDYMKFVVMAWGFSLAGSVGIIADAFKEKGKFRDGVLGTVDRVSKRFVQRLDYDGVDSPTLAALQFFYKLRTKVMIHRKNLPYDYAFWSGKGWLERDFFYETRLNPIKKFLGKLPVRIIKLVMRVKLGGRLYRRIVGEAMTGQPEERA
jgi:multimeric flavodoxin WrbA